MMGGEEGKSILGGGAEDSGVVEKTVVSDDGASGGGGEQPVEQVQAVGFDKVIEANGGMAANWRDVLPPEIRNEKCLENVKTFGALAQNYVHAQKAIGANKVAIPGENATPEELSTFYQALGRPESADKYELSKPENLPPGVAYSEELSESFKAKAFELGLSQKQVAGLAAWQQESLAAQVSTAEQVRDRQYDETVSKLNAEYGDQVPALITQCNRAVEMFGFKPIIERAGLQNDYETIKAFAALGQRISESKLKGDVSGAVINDPATRYNEIIGNPDDPYYKADHPLHDQRVNEVKDLLRRMPKK